MPPHLCFTQDRANVLSGSLSLGQKQRGWAIMHLVRHALYGCFRKVTDERDGPPCVVEVPVGEKRYNPGPCRPMPIRLHWSWTASECSGVEQDLIPIVSRRIASPGSPMKYRSVRVVLSTRTVRESCGCHWRSIPIREDEIFISLRPERAFTEISIWLRSFPSFF